MHYNYVHNALISFTTYRTTSKNLKSYFFQTRSLTADKDKGPSARITSISKMEKSEPPLETQPHSEPHSESGKQTQPSGPKADPPAPTWTNCFGCCTFCS